MKYFLLITFIIINQSSFAEITFSQNPEEFSTKGIKNIKAPVLNSFAEATAWADLVAIAQVDDIEYEKIRDTNVKGYAFLNVLVPYKGSTRGETIAVVAEGTNDNACYYPDRINAGERALVFLKKAPNKGTNVYYGYKPFCQMQILLSDMGQYILRTPLNNKSLKIDESLVEEQTFVDPHAMIDSTLWTSTKREEYALQFKCKIIQTEDTFNKYFHLRYTQGIPIYKIRKLLKVKYKAKITSKQI
jgi:hypothetical protein